MLNQPAIRQINFSLHDFEKNKSKEYIKEILSFSKEAVEKTNIIVSLRLWNMNRNNTPHDKNTDIIELIANEFDLQSSSLNVIKNKKGGVKLKEQLYLNYDYQFVWPDIHDTFINEKGFCFALRHHIAILVDGTVVPCCLDAEGVINMGNVFENNFSDILKSQRANKMYRSFTKNKAVEELCCKCRYKERFVK